MTRRLFGVGERPLCGQVMSSLKYVMMVESEASTGTISLIVLVDAVLFIGRGDDGAFIMAMSSVLVLLVVVVAASSTVPSSLNPSDLPSPLNFIEGSCDSYFFRAKVCHMRKLSLPTQ